MDWYLVQKILLGLAVIATIFLGLRPQKRKENVDPTIAEADERERNVWRHPRWLHGRYSLCFTFGYYRR